MSRLAALNFPLMLAKKCKLCLNRHIMLCAEDPSNHWMVQSQAEVSNDSLTDFGVSTLFFFLSKRYSQVQVIRRYGV